MYGLGADAISLHKTTLVAPGSRRYEKIDGSQLVNQIKAGTSIGATFKPAKQHSQELPSSIDKMTAENSAYEQTKPGKYIPSSFRGISESHQQSGIHSKKVKSRVLPRGVGLPPAGPNHLTSSSYTNRLDNEEKGDTEQGNSLDFLANLGKRDVLSSP